MLETKGRKRSPHGDDYLICLLPDGTWTLLPEWMTDPKRCAALAMVEAPEVSLVALIELPRFLDTCRPPAVDATMPAEASHLQQEV